MCSPTFREVADRGAVSPSGDLTWNPKDSPGTSRLRSQMQCTTVNQISIRPIANHVLGPYRHEEIANVSHVLLYFLLPFTPLLVSYPSCRFPYAFLSCSSSAILLLFPLPPLMFHLFSYSSLLVSSTSFLSSSFSLLFLVIFVVCFCFLFIYPCPSLCFTFCFSFSVLI